MFKIVRRRYGQKIAIVLGRLEEGAGRREDPISIQYVVPK
jgi:hypothetical protein